VAGDHGVEVVDRCVHVHGAHAIDIAVGRGEGLNGPDSAAGHEALSYVGGLKRAEVRAKDRALARLRISSFRSKFSDLKLQTRNSSSKLFKLD
jgi:hypothetical protein